MYDWISKINIENADIPLYHFIANEIYLLIESGEITAKLPSVRYLSEHLKVNNGTIVSAYRLLEEKHAIYKIKGSGTYCNDIKLKKSRYINIQKKPLIPNDIELIADFTKTSVSESLFPVDSFKSIFNTVLERDRGKAFSYQYASGYEPLRNSIAELLTDRAIKTTADRIQIISGSQQGIDLIARAVLQSNDNVFCEQFTYQGAVNAIEARNSNVYYISLEKDGLNIDELEKNINIYKPKLLYLMTNFQTPTGISYSLAKKRAILNLAYKYDIYILEEDNLGDFNYSQMRVTPLKALDYKNKVIYLKSFSKILMPGLRLGFMVLPKVISEQVAGIKYSTDISTSGFLQRSFNLFIQGKNWDLHKQTIVRIFKDRYNFIHKLTQQHLSDYFEIPDPQGGLLIWLKLKKGDISVLYKSFLNEGVAVIPNNFYAGDNNIPYIVLAFSDISNEQAEAGIKVIEQVCRKYFDKEQNI